MGGREKVKEAMIELRISYSNTILNYWLFQEFKLFEYDKFNHHLPFSNTPQPPWNASHNLIQRIIRDFIDLLYFLWRRREGRGGVWERNGEEGGRGGNGSVCEWNVEEG